MNLGSLFVGRGTTATEKMLDAKYDSEANKPKGKAKYGEDNELETPCLVIYVARVSRVEKR